MDVIVNNRVWVPMKQVFVDRATSMYELKLYDEKSCQRCDYLEDRHSEMCDQCPAYLQHYKLWRTREDKNGKTWIGVPKGDTKLLNHFLDGEKPVIRDRRSKARMVGKITFTGQLTKQQQSVIRQLDRKNFNGVIEAPPRSGKTVIGTYIICKLWLKTIVIAAQYDWLKGFYDTFMGNPAQNQPAMTDAPDALRPAVGFCKTVEDFYLYDVCLVTYQSLGTHDNMKTKLRVIKNLFGLVLIDECHDTAAVLYSKVLLELNSAHMIGLTATPDRKDGAYKISQTIVGRVNAKADTQTMIPMVKIVNTGAVAKHKYKLWPYAMRFLRTHKERNALIVKHAVHDIKRGHSIVIPVASIEHCNTLVDMINEHFPDEDFLPAAAFTGRLNKKARDQLIDDARSYRVKCVVGIRKIVQVGLNVPRWSCLYEVEPISNVPKAKQETSRIRTVMEGKRQPLIKIFTEDFPQSKGCFRTLWFQTVLKEKFKVSPETHQIAKKFLAADKKSGGGLRFGGDSGDFIV